MIMGTTTSSASLVARGLVRGYGSGAARVPVLRDLSLQFQPGELSLVVGASGSGKSTLLAILGGLLQPEGGSVTALGTEVWNLSRAERERFRFGTCGFVFQGFNLFPPLTALEQVCLPLQMGGERESVARERAVAALTEVGLSARLHLRPAQLSGGEKQRVAIARALVRSPALLFADEPTSSLDSANAELVVELLQRAAAVHGTTVIVVTHDLRLARHADRVLTLCDGVVIEDVRPAAGQGAAQ